jgi:uncharacterized protein affecting Mg2+/Co2+ transport
LPARVPVGKPDEGRVRPTAGSGMVAAQPRLLPGRNIN